MIFALDGMGSVNFRLLTFLQISAMGPLFDMKTGSIESSLSVLRRPSGLGCFILTQSIRLDFNFPEMIFLASLLTLVSAISLGVVHMEVSWSLESEVCCGSFSDFLSRLRVASSQVLMLVLESNGTMEEAP